MDNQNSQDPQSAPPPQPINNAPAPAQREHQSLVLKPSQAFVEEMKVRDQAVAAYTQQQSVSTVTPENSNPPPPQLTVPEQPSIPTINVPSSYASDGFSDDGKPLPEKKSRVAKLTLVVCLIAVVGIGSYLLLHHPNNTTDASKNVTSSSTQSQSTTTQTTTNNSASSPENAQNPVDSNKQIKSDVNFCSSSPLTC